MEWTQNPLVQLSASIVSGGTMLLAMIIGGKVAFENRKRAQQAEKERQAEQRHLRTMCAGPFTFLMWESDAVAVVAGKRRDQLVPIMVFCREGTDLHDMTGTEREMHTLLRGCVVEARPIPVYLGANGTLMGTEGTGALFTLASLTWAYRHVHDMIPEAATRTRAPASTGS